MCIRDSPKADGLGIVTDTEAVQHRAAHKGGGVLDEQMPVV